MQNQVVSHYEVTNTRTGAVKSYATSAAAIRAMDSMNRAHGSSIAARKAIWVAE